MISHETIQQIISRIDIVEVVGDFVSLKKRGANYLGLCPFHHEKTPSFTVAPSKEIYKCFGCGKSGNTISFLMEHEKLGYPEALRWLAKKYNVEIEETHADPEYKERQQTTDSLYIINQYAANWFQQQLWETEMGMAIAHSYLQQRGFTDDTIRKFELGYSPNEWDAFVNTAKEQQFNTELVLKTGIIASRDQRLYDSYRDRITFPIHNHIGKVIGFGARQIKSNDKSPKYINTPENELYVKSRILYGIYHARQSIDKQNECLLVEGYTDVISLHQAGVENVVASGGTSLTTDQLHLIKRYTSNLTIVYDGDAAGVKAALRGLDLALAEGLNVKLVLIPDKEDPDSYVNKVGAAAFNAFVQENKKDFILFQAEVALQDAGDDVQKRNAVVNRMAESISRVSKAEDFSRQQDYIRQTAQLLRVDEEGLIALVNKHIRDRLEKEHRKLIPQAQLPPEEASDNEADAGLELLMGHELQERAVVKCLLLYGLLPLDNTTRIADYIFQQLEHFDFDNAGLGKVYSQYKQWYAAGMEPNEKTFVYYPDESMSHLVISLLEFPYELSPRWKELVQGKHVDEMEQSILDAKLSIGYYVGRKYKQLMRIIENDLLTATTPEAQDSLVLMHKELKSLEIELKKGLGTVMIK